MSDLIRQMEGLSYKFYGTVVRVVDGDTVKIDIDLGFSVHTVHNIRIANINAAELSTQQGKDARDFLIKLLPTGTKVIVHTDKYKQSFTRYIGDIYLGDGRSVAKLIVDAGFAEAEAY